MRWQKRVISERNLSSDTNGILSQQTASSEPVEKVDDHSDKKPEAKADPGDPGKTQHQTEARGHAENRNERHPWSFEGSVAVRLALPKDPNTDAHQDECE